jgi:hypothetical protein
VSGLLLSAIFKIDGATTLTKSVIVFLRFICSLIIDFESLNGRIL